MKIYRTELKNGVLSEDIFSAEIPENEKLDFKWDKVNAIHFGDVTYFVTDSGEKLDFFMQGFREALMFVNGDYAKFQEAAKVE